VMASAQMTVSTDMVDVPVQFQVGVCARSNDVTDLVRREM